MAQPPHKNSPPPPLKTHADDHPVPTTGGTEVAKHGEAKAAPADPPAKTIADEQRERAAEIEAMGVDAWKASHDESTEEEKAGIQVAGTARLEAAKK